MKDSFETIKSKKRRTAVEVVIDGIKDLLIHKKIKAGDLLPNENEISELLQVSRGSTREAFKILNAYGVIDIRRGDGTYVSDGPNQNMFTPLLFQILVKNRDFSELIEVRQLLENGLLGLAIKHGTDEDMLNIKAACDAFEIAILRDGASPAECRNLDIALHTQIAIAAHNSIVQEIYSFVMELFEPSMAPSNAGVVESHRGMVNAICDHDIDEARYWLTKHTYSWTSKPTES